MTADRLHDLSREQVLDQNDWLNALEAAEDLASEKATQKSNPTRRQR